MRGEGGPRSGGRVLASIQSPIMSLIVRSMITPVRRKKASDSEIGTQILKGPFRRRWRQLPLPKPRNSYISDKVLR